MSDDNQDPIIDSLLEEFLGDLQAPDLKERILRHPGAQQASRGTTAEPRPAAATEFEPPRVALASPSRNSRRTGADWRGWSTVAVTLMIASVLGIFALRQNGEMQPGPPAAVADIGPTAPPPPANQPKETPDISEQQPLDLEAPAPPSNPPRQPQSPNTPPPARRGLQRRRALRPPSPTTTIVKNVNQALQSNWKSAGLQPPAPVGAKTWCQRAYQSLVGRAPTPQELRDFSVTRSKRRLVDSLCASSEFSTHWGQKLARVLVGKHYLPNRASREELAGYLSSSLQKDKGYDELVYELLTAEGSSQAQQEDYNAATHFLLALKVNTPDRARAASHLCRLFLGKQVGCAACHDHPTDPTIPQEKFWEISSYLAQATVTAVKGRRATRLFDVDLAGTAGALDEAATFFDDPDGNLAAVYPAFFNQVASSRSGQLRDIVRREELANRIVNSGDFSRAFVNRMWSQVFGAGFTQPVDDMGPHNSPSHPELLEGLAAEFQASNFDIRELVRWVVLSAAFDRQAVRSDGLIAANDHLFVDFESYAAKRPKLGPALDSLAKAHQEGKSFDGTLIGNMMLVDPGVPQRKNKLPPPIPRFRRLNSTNQTIVRRLAASEKLTNDQKVEHLFQTLLGRQPFERERSDAARILDAQSATLPALQELATTLLNSEEGSVEH